MPDDLVWLRKLPYEWDSADTERAKELFVQRRPAVPAVLVGGLWNYWTEVCPTKLLFENRQDNQALVLHARAFGYPVSREAAGIPPGKLAEMLSGLDDEPYCRPLVPAPLPWGPRAALAPQVRAALSSSLLNAWVTEDGHGPVEVLVVGQGLPEIRQQVVPAAIMTSLRINALADPEAGTLINDLLSVGLIRLSAGVGRQEAIDIPPMFQARQMRVALGAARTAQGALREFVTLLRRLERDSNLVRVERLGNDDLQEFDHALRTMVDRASQQPSTAFLRSPTGNDSGPELVGLLPYLRTAARVDATEGSSVGLNLSPDLLATDSFQRLENAHHAAMAERTAMDARLRRDQLVDEVKAMIVERDAFAEATPEERQLSWNPTVLLEELFDNQLGITIKLAEPEEVDIEVYFAKNVPNLIKMRQEWADWMGQVVQNLEKAISEPHAPARQIAAGRFLDAAIRDVTPDESASTTQAFERWRQQVQPMLWFEWRCALEQQGVDAADLFTRHTVLATRYLAATHEQEAFLFTHPYSVVDKNRSAVLADADRRVVVVRDVTDHGEPISGTTDDSETADSAWDELVRLAEHSTTEERFSAAFLDALRRHPGPVVRHMIDQLRPPDPGATEAEEIARALRSAERATALATGMQRAQAAARAGAFHTARAALDEVRDKGVTGDNTDLEVRAWLLRAVVECYAAEMPYREIPQDLALGAPTLPHEVHRALDEARNLDDTYATDWLNQLAESDDLGKAIRRLFLGLPRTRKACNDPQQYAVLLFRRAIELISMARQLEKIAGELSEEHEAIDAVLARVGKTLEGILVGRYMPGAHSEARALLEVLTGEEHPKYGRTVG